MDDAISRIEAALEDHVLYLFTDAGNHAFSAADIRALLDRLKSAEAERDSFYMDYRMKCDEETKRQAIEIERLRAALEYVVSLRTGGMIEGRCRAALENTNEG